MAKKQSEIMRDKGIEVELQGKLFEVKFDLNALCNLQDKFGDISKAFENLDMTDLKKVRSLLHIGLANGENAEITELEVGALIDMQNINDVVDALTQGISAAMPSTDEEGK